MEFLKTTEGILIFSLVSLILTCLILYFVIKAAIIDALKEHTKSNASLESNSSSIPTPTWSADQIALKDKYEKGDISLEDYTKEWNKL